MDLYLVRHGSALSKEEDPERPLSARGRGEVARVAQAAAAAGLRASELLCSEKTRARQTAERLAAAFGCSAPEGGLADLAPDADPAALRGRIDAAEQSLLLVGHLPHLGRLASLLLSEDADADLVDWPAAGLLRLRRGDDGKWRLVAFLTPDLAVSS